MRANGVIILPESFTIKFNVLMFSTVEIQRLFVTTSNKKKKKKFVFQILTRLIRYLKTKPLSEKNAFFYFLLFVLQYNTIITVVY